MERSASKSIGAMAAAIVIALLVALAQFAFVEVGCAEAAEKPAQTIKVPQVLYGVSTDAQPFSINAQAKTGLSYESSNESVATVASDGKVTVTGKEGKAVVTITAAETEDYREAQSKVTVRVTAYKPANGRMVHSASDKDGKIGDSTGDESMICHYHKWHWGFVIRCNDPYVANLAAYCAKFIVQNEHFGYDECLPVDQATVDKRASIYKAVRRAVGDKPTYRDLKKIADIDEYADSSCSPTLFAGYWLFYDMDTRLSLAWKPPYDQQEFLYYCGSANIEYHQIEKAIAQVNKEYLEAGKLRPFEIIYVPEDEQDEFFDPANIENTLKRGDIICRCPDPAKGGHTAMVM